MASGQLGAVVMEPRPSLGEVLPLWERPLPCSRLAQGAHSRALREAGLAAALLLPPVSQQEGGLAMAPTYSLAVVLGALCGHPLYHSLAKWVLPSLLYRDQRMIYEMTCPGHTAELAAEFKPGLLGLDAMLDVVSRPSWN